MLLLPLGHPRKNEGVFPLFSAVRTMESVTKSVEKIRTSEYFGIRGLKRLPGYFR